MAPIRPLIAVLTCLGFLLLPGPAGAVPVPSDSATSVTNARAAKVQRGVVTTVLPRVGASRGQYTRAGAVTHDKQGRVLVAGSDHQHLVVARYRKNGRLDRSFGRKGIARVRIHRSVAEADAIAVDGRGRIVVAASHDFQRAGKGRLVVLRFTQRGKLDRKFGQKGRFVRQRSVAGGLLVLGSRVIVTGRSLRPSGALALRLTAQGRLDRRFGSNGTTRFSVYGAEEGVVVGTGAGAATFDRAGRIVVNVGVFRGIAQPAENGVARLLPNGRLDPTFYGGGYWTGVEYGPEGRSAETAGIVVARNGDLLTTGGVDGRFLLMGYSPDGAPTGIRAHAKLAKGYDQRGTAIAQDRHGRLVSVGRAALRMGITRHTADHRLDRSFAGNGKQTLRVPGFTELDTQDVAIDPRGRIVVIATGHPRGVRAKPAMVVVRLKPNGTLDKSWRG